MSNPENPWSKSGNKAPDMQAENESEILPDIVLFNKLATLKEVLEYEREPDYESRSFQFDVATLSEAVMLPGSVENILNKGHTLENMSITCAYLPRGLKSEISFEVVFVFQNESENEEKILTVIRPYNYFYHSDQYDIAASSPLEEDDSGDFQGEIADVEDPTEKIPAVSPTEFNRFLGSLIYNIPKDSRIFNDFSWQFDRLMDQLAIVADTSTGEIAYLLDAPDGGFSGEFSYDFHDDEVTEFQLSRILRNAISVGPTGDIDYEHLAVRTFANDVEGTAVSFWRNQHINDQPLTTIIPNEDADYEATIDFIDSHIRKNIEKN